MKALTIILFFLTVFIPMVYPSAANAGDIAKTADGPWQLQNLQAWGRNKLAADFGTKGLWNYDGSWIQLSQWNPKQMEAWGTAQLAVDFGQNGLWTYDGKTWKRISLKTP